MKYLQIFCKLYSKVLAHIAGAYNPKVNPPPLIGSYRFFGEMKMLLPFFRERLYDHYYSLIEKNRLWDKSFDNFSLSSRGAIISI
jgi:hypothetical protein